MKAESDSSVLAGTPALLRRAGAGPVPARPSSTSPHLPASRRLRREWFGPRNRVLTSLLALSLTAAAPAGAGPPGHGPATAGAGPAPAREARASLTALGQQAVSAMAPAAPRGNHAFAQQAAKPAAEKPRTWSFFKSPAGIAVIVTVGVALGYAFSSMDFDHAPAPPAK